MSAKPDPQHLAAATEAFHQAEDAARFTHRPGIFVLSELIEHAIERDIDDMTSVLEDIADLIGCNPVFQAETDAMRQMAAARDVLVKCTYEARALLEA